MNKEQIIEILDAWNFWNESKEKSTGIIRQTYHDKLEELTKTNQIIAITGARRSGKSTIILQYIKNKISQGIDRKSFIYINFEEPKFSGLMTPEFLIQIYEAYLEIIDPKEIPYIFLDEVQNIKGWERFARSLHEKKEAKVFVSGSTSGLISKEIGTVLTGRWLELRVYPLDFKEYLNFNNLKITSKYDLISNKIKIKQHLREYLEFGGFPLVVLTSKKQEILNQYFDDIIQKDISLRQNIRKTDKLKELAKYYLTNFTGKISYRNISKFIDLSVDSIERYSEYMNDAYLLYFIPKYSYSLKEQSVNPRVVYGVDNGLINTVGFRFTDNIGKLIENTTYLKLTKEKKEIYYHKSEKKECDFLVKERNKITQAIQVTQTLNDENKKRELGGLLEAMEKYNLKEGLILTEDQEDELKHETKTIHIKPIWKWLLE